MFKYICFLLLFLSCLFSYELRLYPPSKLYIRDHHVTANLKTSDEIINEEFKEYLKYGIVIHFTYFINFYREELFFDDLLEAKKVQVTLKYDLWSKEYKLIRYYPRKLESSFKNIKEVARELTKLNSIKVISVSKLDDIKAFYFKTRVTAKISQYESYFHVLFSLLSIVKYKTTYLVSPSYSGHQLRNLSNALEK